MDGLPLTGGARRPHRIEGRRHASRRHDVRRLDVGGGYPCGASGPLRWPRTGAEHCRHAVVVELGARQPELREHGAAWRRRTHLLLRAIEPIVESILVEAAVDAGTSRSEERRVGKEWRARWARE